MKILAINSSPRAEGQSKTSLMLNALVGGMRSAGAEVETAHLREKKIRYCSGCYTCWTKTPGVCIHKDDMTEELYPKWLASDLAVYATPLYHFMVNAAMKTFIERTLPVLQPFIRSKGERTYHPLRHKHPRAVFLSVAGFPEKSVFDQLSSWANFIYGRSGALVAEIYRPAAETMAVPAFRAKKDAILEATAQAGREIVTSSAVTADTMEAIQQPVVEDYEAFRKIGDCMWKTCIAEGITPREFGERGMIPRPDSLETFMAILPMGFNPSAAGDLTADLQFRFSGQVQGACYFHIEKGAITPSPDEAQQPSLTIETPFEVWMDIMAGKADGQQMFMEQKYKVNGDLSILLRMKELFSGPA